MDEDAEAFGFADDPDWSLEPKEGEMNVWIAEDVDMVALQFGDDNPTYLSPARAREMATGLERGASNTDLERKTKREVALIRRAADRAEGATVRLKVPVPRVQQARGNLEPGLYKVSREEARLIIRGMATEIAHERLRNAEGTTKDEIHEEAADVLTGIGENLQE